MDEHKKNRRILWIYSIILLSGALLVLLLTAYSQLKMNRNIDDYKDRISQEKLRNQNYRSDLESMKSENKKLKEELDKLNKKFIVITASNNDLNTKINELQSMLNISNNINKAIEEACIYYQKGDAISCALSLNTVSEKALPAGPGKDLYDYLSVRTFYKSALKLYDKAKTDYKNSEYASAKDEFSKALSLEGNVFFSDDCMFFIANCETHMNDAKSAVNTILQLLSRYPESSYAEDASYMLARIGK